MGSSVRLGKIFGIPIYLHYSWFVIFAYFAAIIAIELLGDYSLGIRIIGGIATSLVFFACVLAHELSHSLVAIKNDIPIRSITLFILGGVAQITREAARPKTELVMAIAGPLCSLVLAFVFGMIWFLLRGTQESSFDPILWLAGINLALALFNLLPGFPLDGGRVLRALLWQGTGNYMWATRIASLVGRGIAYLLIIGGLIMIFVGPYPLNGLVLIIIGWFLENAASSSYRQARLRDALQGFTARDVMSTDYSAVPPDLSLKDLTESYILLTGRHYFVVASEGRFRGIITLPNIKAVPQQQWDITPVSAAMTPADKLVTVLPGEDAISVLERMQEQNISQIPVVIEGAVVGVIMRDTLLRFVRLRSQLGIQR